MKLPDANFLLYAVNESDPKHEPAQRWLDGMLNGTETVGFAWTVVLAFLRLSTKVGLFPNPLAPDDALQRARQWLAQEPATMVEPTARHLVVLGGLLAATGTGGNLVADAHLAALALEHDATVVSYDTDFSRFSGIRWTAPQ